MYNLAVHSCTLINVITCLSLCEIVYVSLNYTILYISNQRYLVGKNINENFHIQFLFQQCKLCRFNFGFKHFFRNFVFSGILVKPFESWLIQKFYFVQRQYFLKCLILKIFTYFTLFLPTAVRLKNTDILGRSFYFVLLPHCCHVNSHVLYVF